MSPLREKIAQLQDEIARLKRTARCPHDPKPGIGGVIQTIRQKQELSINQLSAKCSVSKGQLSRLERLDDPNIGLHVLRRIAKALGHKASSLIAAAERLAEEAQC